MADTFISDLCERIRAAGAAKTALRIRSGGSKDFYGEAPRGETIDVSGYSGIVAYEPKELVLTVKAGTPLREVERVLEGERQMLAFEPPRFASLDPADASRSRATIGGTVAAGLSGPRRPYAGAVRDFVLGARIVNGKGEDLSFGGRVIKNVAGYDVSRLMTGALGTLGVITEISFKVLPRPPASITLSYPLDEAAATRQVNVWAGQPLPLSGTAWLAGRLLVRLSGAESAVAAARAKMGGDEATDLPDFWEALRDHRIAFFDSPNPLWRLSVPQTAAPIPTSHHQLIEWGGGQRWISGDLNAGAIRAAVQAAGGHATLFRHGDKSVGVFHPLQPALMKIHRRLKDAFDPHGILNPGRMYTFGALGPLSGPSREDQNNGET
jgi:glycolate oxidase FAD binding subunit